MECGALRKGALWERECFEKESALRKEGGALRKERSALRKGAL